MITLNVRSVVLAIALVVTLLVVGYGSVAYSEGYVPFGPRDDEWTGVFLTNGQAYFGHFYSGPGDYAKLRDVHYVLATQLQSQNPSQQGQTALSLQKLGGEIHGPKTEMKIAKSQILFIEELRADSPVVQSIIQLRTATPAPAPTATQAPATQAPVVTASPSQARSPSPSPR